ncbi:MAG: ligase-associated DNA damage response endonuclease PdeM [Geminicoccaceae bacterium]
MAEPSPHAVTLGEAIFRLDPVGAAWWAERRLLVVADLHLEKGSAFARRGVPLPPYDSRATLARLEMLVTRLQPDIVVSLGDGFHDRRGIEALEEDVATGLRRLTGALRWVWIQGNHDPEPPPGLGGESAAELEIGGVVLRHHARGGTGAEIAGHLHPKARLAGSRRRMSRPCFASDGTRLLLPAFGAFTGGLNVLDPAIASLFPAGFDAFLLGEERVFRVPHDRLEPELRTRVRP